MMKPIPYLFILSLLFSACASPIPPPDMPVSDGENPEQPRLVMPIGDTPPQPAMTEPLPPSQPGGKNLSRGNVFIKGASLLIRESYPPQIALVISGELPTPCHELKAEFNEPDSENNITVDVYSLVNTDMACIQVIQPFEETIELGTFPSGHYFVFVNGEKAGEFDS